MNVNMVKQFWKKVTKNDKWEEGEEKVQTSAASEILN